MVVSLSSPPPISFFSSSSPCKSLSFPLTPFRPPSPPSRSGLCSQSPRKTLKESRFRVAAAAAATAKLTPETVAQSAIERISEKLSSLGYLEGGASAADDDGLPATGPGSAGEIFIPTPREIPARRVGCTIDASWSTPEHPVPRPGSGFTINRFPYLWRREKAREAADRRAVKDAGARLPPTVAELTIPPGELKRLRRDGIQLQKRLKVGKAGITEGIVNGIHERWRKSELVKIKCEDLCRMNMKRTHEILERKTGGLVVWRSGSIIIMYRGVGYKYPYLFEGNKKNEIFDEVSSSGVDNKATNKQEPNTTPMLSSESHDTPSRSLVVGVGSPKKARVQLEGERQLEEEADRLLDGLGPRFTDWWGCDPLPVDADLLPGVVPGFRRPFRLIPFGIKPKLTDREITILKRLARLLPCHFAIGRNRNHQGLAVSMIKLWEKCEVAKIAIKRGVQNTNSELISEELKKLSGGTLLSRDREFIVFYRGKDFLPSAVSVAIEKRRNYGSIKQKKIADENCLAEAITASETKRSSVASSEVQKERSVQQESFGLDRRLTSANLALRRMENRLSQAIEKKEKAEKSLKIEVSMKTPKVEADKEGISEEERYMLRKVGLKMRPFLLLGRRGVFDGTVENMHLHWKYRELTKIISKDRNIINVESAARILEAESGGILVAIERVSRGHAIIMYRGKNYRRPVTLRPNTLLNKREAMKQSLEAQRYESLKLHVLSISKKVNQIKSQMVKDDLLIDPLVVGECQTSSNVIATTECSEKENKESEGLDEEMHRIDSESLHVEEFSDISNDTMQIVSTANELCYDSFQNSARCDRLMALNPHGEDSDAKDEPVSSAAMADSAILEDKTDMMSYAEVPFRAAPLSNRERLVLRKQALKMKKRPVIAVGRSNVVSGVARTIMTHFRKHPLAIVNIKGREKGTSVQQLIFDLEQATGAVLVSREPNKVILYRGWGEGEAPARVKQHNSRVSDVDSMVSPQLMEAFRLECGIQTTA